MVSQTIRRTKAQMYPLVEQWNNSTESKNSFCSAHGINPATFYYWQSKYEKEYGLGDKPQGSFLRLEPGTSSGMGSVIEILSPCGYHIRFSGLVPVAYIKQLISHV